MSVAPWSPAPFPGGKRFAFTIMDDTDVATVANVAPIYRLLHELGMRTTKTVWPVACPEGSPNFAGSETLEDPVYRDFVLELGRQGFEIAFHGATMESSPRERIVRALALYESVLGRPPRVFANHAFNQDNLYWGAARFDDSLVRLSYRFTNGRRAAFYQGHVAGSPFWWGDLASARIRYARNLTFGEVNLLRVNPTMPYVDPRRPLVPRWFSASDAEHCGEFNRLLAPDRLRELEAEGGLCIVATHLGKGYVRNGEVVPATRRILELLAARSGWFVPVGELLDWLQARQGGAGTVLPPAEWRSMQWRWLRDVVRRKAGARLRDS